MPTITEETTISEVKTQLKAKIEQLQQQKREVVGTPCEVFSRVVGYLRPVQFFNKGKRAEYDNRKMFKLNQ